MAPTYSYVQECYNELINSELSVKNVTKLSELLNRMIEDYEQLKGANIMVSNVGFQVYPDQYSSQKKIQLFDIVPKV